MTNTENNLNLSEKQFIRMARAELKIYGDTPRYRRLVALANKAEWK